MNCFPYFIFNYKPSVCSECGLALPCWNKQSLSCIRHGHIQGRRHMLFQNLYISFSINDALTDVPATHILCTSAPPYNHKGWLLNCKLITSWMDPSFFTLEDTASMSSRHNFKFWPIRPQDSFSLAAFLDLVYICIFSSYAIVLILVDAETNCV